MTKTTFSIVAVVLAVTTSGCASISIPFVGHKPEVVSATPQNPVVDAITLWQPGEGRGLDNLPTRGFAGQLLFFTYRHPTPARVDGKVTVYVFDDVGSVEEQSRPIWQRTFGSEEWNALGMQTNLGTAYQMFVPYTRKGDHEAHCSLRIKFEPSDGGPPVYSKMSGVTLPGAKSQLGDSKLTHKRIEPKRLEHDADAAMSPLADVSDQATQRRLKSSTVALPGQRRLTAQTAARLQQLAHEMVRDQQKADGGVQQAAYFTESSDQADTAEPTERSTRYQLYR